MSQDRPRQVAAIIRADLPDGETVVRVAEGDAALILNATGDAVLTLCDGTRTVAEIASFLRGHVDVPAHVDLDADVARMIAELARAGLIDGAEVT